MIYSKPKAFQLKDQIILACLVTLFMLTSPVNAAEIDCADCEAQISQPRQQYLAEHEHATIDIELVAMNLESQDAIPFSYTLQVFLNDEPFLEEEVFAFPSNDGSGTFSMKTGFSVLIPTGEKMELRYDGWNGTYKGKTKASSSSTERGWDGTYKGDPVKLFSGTHVISIKDYNQVLLKIEVKGHEETGAVTIIR